MLRRLVENLFNILSASYTYRGVYRDGDDGLMLEIDGRVYEIRIREVGLTRDEYDR